ncbi:MAG TPA: VCBS repeat-containing protein [Thermoanaerobaculia bacterium]|nr:VCBS repeat-containing protein [Thermoanaerobaculia bacterium]
MRLALLPLLLLLSCTPATASTANRIVLPNGFHPQAIAASGNEIAVCGRRGDLAIVHGGTLIFPHAWCGANPTHMIAADVNGDGMPDFVVANHDTDYITLLQNHGGGRFTSHQIHVHSKPHPHTVAAADVNGDGQVDLITDSWAENRVTLVLADGHGGWESPGIGVPTGRGPYVNVVAADLDGDGHTDLAMPNARPDDPHDSVTILFGDGRGHFEPAAQSPIVAGPAPFMIAVADVNGDKRPDILVANYSGHITDTARDGLTWIRNDGGRHFTAFPERIVAGHGSWHIAAGDVNGDGFDDVAFNNAAEKSVTVVYGSSAGPRPGPTPSVTLQPEDLAIFGRRVIVIGGDRDEIWSVPVR